jgi:hypothetical protein
MVNILSFLTPKSETLYLNNDSTIRQILESFDYYSTLHNNLQGKAQFVSGED